MSCVRKILPHAKDFKRFWKDKGPFRYALTSNEYPPVLLAPEQWIFGDDKTQVLKELMGFETSKMTFVPAPFNPNKKSILRPEALCAWKITHFPEAWHTMVCDAFVPEGHLTQAVIEEATAIGVKADKAGIETAFFSLMGRQMETMGYVLLEPRGTSTSAAIADYLAEWEEDDADAGLYSD